MRLRLYLYELLAGNRFARANAMCERIEAERLNRERRGDISILRHSADYVRVFRGGIEVTTMHDNEPRCTEQKEHGADTNCPNCGAPWQQHERACTYCLTERA